MTKKYRERYSVDGVNECELYPGVERLVRTLKAQGLNVAVATGKPTAFTVEILRSHGLDGLFDDVLGSEFDGTRGAEVGGHN